MNASDHLLLGIVRRTCPPSDRRWLDAMLAELQAVEGRWSRFAWILGVARFAAVRRRERVASLVTNRHVVGLIVLLTAAISAFLSQGASESLGLDDDLFLASGAASGALLLWLLTFQRIRGTSPPRAG